MANNLIRAEFWKTFIATQSAYPAVDRLRAQLEFATFSDFCECGCNSFAVKANPDALSLLAPHDGPGHRAIFTVDFEMADDKTLEIILFANTDGDLDYIQVECCANSYPVPELIEVGRPVSTWASDYLLL